MLTRVLTCVDVCVVVDDGRPCDGGYGWAGHGPGPSSASTLGHGGGRISGTPSYGHVAVGQGSRGLVSSIPHSVPTPSHGTFSHGPPPPPPPPPSLVSHRLFLKRSLSPSMSLLSHSMKTTLRVRVKFHLGPPQLANEPMNEFITSGATEKSSQVVPPSLFFCLGFILYPSFR